MVFQVQRQLFDVRFSRGGMGKNTKLQKKLQILDQKNSQKG